MGMSGHYRRVVDLAFRASRDSDLRTSKLAVRGRELLRHFDLSRSVLDMDRGRRIQMTVVVALLTVVIGNAVLHAPVGAAYTVAVLVGILAWLITGRSKDRQDNS
jgi:hypothetical protein